MNDDEKTHLSPDEQEKLRAWIEAEDELAVAEASGVSRFTIARALGGLPVRFGSRQLLRAALAER